MKIEIFHFNESYVKIKTERSVMMELFESFSFRVEGYRFMPKYIAGIWDGYIRLINLKENTIPKGLVPAVIDWAADREYKIFLSEEFKRPFLEKIDFDPKSLSLPFDLHDFQENALDIILKKKRQLILSATGSGKSLIIYSTVRAIQDYISETEPLPYKTLIIVPTVSLVEQLYGDFEDYAKNSDFDVEQNVHKIYSGKDKVTEKPIIISTWQSLQRLDASYFKQFKFVVGDEAHTYSATVSKRILDSCVNAFYRMGLTGTLQDSTVNEMQLVAMFGPVTRVSSSKDLMEKNILTQLAPIKGIVLKYSEEVCNAMKNALYKDEIDFLVRNQRRNAFITKLAFTRKNNTLVLFQYVEKHGKVLKKMFDELNKDESKKIFMVYGGTDAESRENVRKICETYSNVIILASFPVFSTGVNIKNLHNVILASPSKSKVKILQSIGRSLRKHESKEVANIFDIGDDLRGTRKKNNTTLVHFIERCKIYMNEGFTVEFKEINI